VLLDESFNLSGSHANQVRPKATILIDQAGLVSGYDQSLSGF
jgi:hypothetical protein